MGCVSPVGIVFESSNQWVRAPIDSVQSSRVESVSWKYGWKPMATGIGSVLRFSICVRTSSAPSASR